MFQVSVFGEVVHDNVIVEGPVHIFELLSEFLSGRGVYEIVNGFSDVSHVLFFEGSLSVDVEFLSPVAGLELV